MPDAEQALIVAAYKFAGTPDPERLAVAFLAQSREPLRIRMEKLRVKQDEAEPPRVMKVRVVHDDPPPSAPVRIKVHRLIGPLERGQMLRPIYAEELES